MTIKLTPTSFLTGIRQSGLLDAKQFDAALADLERDGINQEDAAALAAALVKRGVLTEWQSDKLLQGRHKGFVLGRYKLLSLLGAGEMSAVYLAEHTLLERRCAIKVLPGNRVKDTSYLERFRREAKAVASLNHPNIVRAYDVDKQVEGGIEIHFLVMEYVEGRNLEKIVTMKGPLRYADAAEYIRQAAEGLNHAHQAGLVHRDIKPENLLIDGNGIVKILDLGLARLFEQTDEESLTIKHDEKVLGTADYLAPEQAIDSHKVDARADIYSLGCTLYFALTGHPPFTEGTLVQRLFAHQTKSPKPINQERPDAPATLIAILDKMIAKKAADRYQSAAELSIALTRWLAENGGRAWRTKNVALVAGVFGLEALAQRPTSAGQPAAQQPAPPVAPKPAIPPKKAPDAVEQPEIYMTSRLKGSPRPATDSSQPATDSARPRNPMNSNSEIRRAGSSRPSAANVNRRTPAPATSRSQTVNRSNSAETSLQASASIQQRRTFWMMAWLAITILAIIGVSTLIMWFVNGNFASNHKPQTFDQSEMVIGG